MQLPILIVLLMQSSCLNFETTAKIPRLAVTSLTKIECDHDPKICTISFCQMKPIAREKKYVHFGCSVDKPIYNITLRVKHFLKNSKNIYNPGVFDSTIPICEVNNGMNNPLLLAMLPHIRDVLGKYAHPCPYLGDESINITVDSLSFPPMAPSGNFKLEFDFAGNNSEWYYTLRVFGYLRNPNWVVL